MKQEEKIQSINAALKEYFKTHTEKEPAKNFMKLFIQKGIFNKDEKDGFPIRKLLRDLDKSKKLKAIPYIIAERKEANTNWFFAPSSEAPQIIEKATIAPKKETSQSKGRSNSDEYYVIDLCDEILKQKASRQHTFDFLRGDGNPGKKLPVDAYYAKKNLVVEYYEKQHTESVSFFDNKQTVSGVSRGEQRKIYDARRKEILPKHGISIVTISYSDFGSTKKLKRNKEADLAVVRRILKKHIDNL